jgi:hypothetical protein
MKKSVFCTTPGKAGVRPGEEVTLEKFRLSGEIVKDKKEKFPVWDELTQMISFLIRFHA